MEFISFDCLGKICMYLPIKDLVNLSKSCSHCWKALKSKKLAYVWHWKYWNHHSSNWNAYSLKWNAYSLYLKNNIFRFPSDYQINLICSACDPKRDRSKFTSTGDWECRCREYL